MLVKAAFCQELIEEELWSLRDIKFSLFWDNRPTDQDLLINPINVYGLSEPNEYFGNLSWIKDNHHKFDAVLTWDTTDIPNAIFSPFGTTPFFRRYDLVPGTSSLPQEIYPKKSIISFIRGNKHFNVPGHHLRWELWNRQNEIRVPKVFFAQTSPEYASTPEEEVLWFDQRQSIFEGSKFHIAIENTSHDNYFTEKIMDCFLFKSIPIYYGCPNINKFFNPEGIITFNTIDELISICNNLNPNIYEEKREFILENFLRSFDYLNLGKTIANKLNRFFSFNRML